MEWHQWPIKDYGVPNAISEVTWPNRPAKLRGLLGTSGRVLVNCKGGLGRVSSIAARLLVEFGVPVEEAIFTVRAVCPGAIENREPESWVTLGPPMPLPETKGKICLEKQFSAPWMDGDWTLRQRLTALAQFRTIFEQPGFRFSELTLVRGDGDVTVFKFLAYTTATSFFNEFVYGYGWFRRIDWTTWRETKHGTQLMRVPGAMSGASEDDLAHVITVCLRADRCCDRYLNEAYEAGLLTRLVIRAAKMRRHPDAVFARVLSGQALRDL